MHWIGGANKQTSKEGRHYTVAVAPEAPENIGWNTIFFFFPFRFAEDEECEWEREKERNVLQMCEMWMAVWLSSLSICCFLSSFVFICTRVRYAERDCESDCVFVYLQTYSIRSTHTHTHPLIHKPTRRECRTQFYTYSCYSSISTAL